MPSKPQNRGANVSLYNLTKNTNALHFEQKGKIEVMQLEAVCCSMSVKQL